MKVHVVTSNMVYTYTDGKDIMQLMSQLDGRDWITLPPWTEESMNTKIIQDLEVGESITQLELITNSTILHKSKIESITTTKEMWKTKEKE